MIMLRMDGWSEAMISVTREAHSRNVPRTEIFVPHFRPQALSCATDYMERYRHEYIVLKFCNVKPTHKRSVTFLTCSHVDIKTCAFNACIGRCWVQSISSTHFISTESIHHKVEGTYSDSHAFILPSQPGYEVMAAHA